MFKIVAILESCCAVIFTWLTLYGVVFLFTHTNVIGSSAAINRALTCTRQRGTGKLIANWHFSGWYHRGKRSL
jgi:hypothetical protein